MSTAPTGVTIPNDGTPTEKRAAAAQLRAMFEQYGTAAALVNARRLEREADAAEDEEDTHYGRYLAECAAENLEPLMRRMWRVHGRPQGPLG